MSRYILAAGTIFNSVVRVRSLRPSPDAPMTGAQAAQRLDDNDIPAGMTRAEFKQRTRDIK